MTTEPTAPRLIYCPHRGGLKQVCETPNACAGGADCRRGVDPAVSQTRAGDLPDEFARFIGGNWVRRYGHMIADDPDFVAAAIYRVMRLAMTDPNSFELGLLEGTPMTQTTAWRRGRLEVWAIRYLIKLGWVLRTGPDGYISGLLVRGSESNV